MSDLGVLRKEIDRESTKIRLALLKCEVRVEMMHLQESKEATKILSIIRKIYIQVYEKLQNCMENVSCDRGDDGFRKVRELWRQGLNEARAILDKLDEIVYDLECRPTKDLDTECLKFYISELTSLHDNPPKVYYNIQEIGYPLGPPLREEYGGDDGDSFHSALSDQEGGLKINVPNLLPSLSSHSSPLVGIGPLVRKANLPVYKIKSGDYSLQSDFILKSQSRSSESSGVGSESDVTSFA